MIALPGEELPSCDEAASLIDWLETRWRNILRRFWSCDIGVDDHGGCYGDALQGRESDDEIREAARCLFELDAIKKETT